MNEHVRAGILDEFIENRTSRPIPLKRTAYAVEVLGGLAAVTVTRLFRNDESGPIEATITFPAPFEAVVTDLVTKVGGRTLVGKAVAKAQARETYEDAIDRGKAAVLHEELLRGLHMVSVANVAPGAEVEVAATFVMPFSHLDGSWRLRIPVTVGQVYGQIPLPESDALLTGGPAETAEVTVTSKSGTILVLGQALKDGRAFVTLNRPIDIEVIGADLSPLVGRAADGRAVTLKFDPVGRGQADLDADILLDTSGSMDERASLDDEAAVTKWEVARAGLVSAARQKLTARDRVGLWVFSSTCRLVDRATGDRFEALVRNCPFDRGGTELASAIAKVTAARSEANVLLITDGKSWKQIDVQAALATGARFTVVLVGEDLLEVNVGYLAALSGGQMFVVNGSDADLAIVAAISSMRGVASPTVPVKGSPTAIERVVGGVRISAEWAKAKKGMSPREGTAARVAAFAAGLAIAGMNETEAAALAEAEGIVSHLTSIVLVDEEGVAVEGVPSTRKVPLAVPATAASVMSASTPMFLASADHACGDEAPTVLAAQSTGRNVRYLKRSPGELAMSSAPFENDRNLDYALERLTRRSDRIDARVVARHVAWDRNADALSHGDLSSQPDAVKIAIAKIAALEAVTLLAKALGKSPVVIAIALVAKMADSRTAARIARAILGGADATLLKTAERAI